jgi:hypothetical protein
MRISLVSAATRPANLGLLLLAVVASVVVALWLLVPGIIAYGIVVVLTALDPQSRVVSRPAPPLNTAFQEQIDGILRAQAEIERSVASTEGALRAALERVAAQVGGIVEEAYALARKGQTVVNYLQGVSLGELNGQLARVEQQMAAATDPQLIAQYQQTRAAVAERLRNAQALGTYRERVTAQLENIRANLDNVHAETIRLRAAQAADTGLSTDSVAERLADVRADMDALGHVLDSALTGAP